MIISKSLLKFFWLNKMFSTGTLTLQGGAEVEVEAHGFPVENSSIDFSSCSLVTGDVTLHGSVRVDVRASDWRREGSVENPASDNVILHVVTEADVLITQSGRPVPTFVMKVPNYIMDGYAALSRECRVEFSYMDDLFRENILARVMTDRLARKSDEVLEINLSLDGDWGRTAMVVLMRSMGYKDSKIYYDILARRMPFHVIRSECRDVEALEAVLLGVGGFLGIESRDPYVCQLQVIYRSLRGRYNLMPTEAPGWEKGRRPCSQAQLQLVRMAAIMAGEATLLEKLLHTTDYYELIKLLQSRVSPYWQTHSALGEETGRGLGTVSWQVADRMILNGVIPLLYAFGRFTRDEALKEQATDIYEQIDCEDNKYVRSWTLGEYCPRTGYHSQALIQLSVEYCERNRCAECPLGWHLLLDYYRKYSRAIAQGVKVE